VKVAGAFQELFGTDPAIVQAGVGLDEIAGWDSLGHVSLASKLEQTFEVLLDMDELAAPTRTGQDRIRAIETGNLQSRNPMLFWRNTHRCRYCSSSVVSN